VDELDSEIAELRRRLDELEGRKRSKAQEPATLEPPPINVKASPDRLAGWSPLIAAGLLISAVVGLGFCSVGQGGSKPSGNLTTEATALTSPAENSTATASISPPPNWNYSDEKDAMTDKVTHTACTTSTNMVHLNPPYSDVDAQLCIRRSPRFGLDVFINLNGSGQILCRSYEDCTVHVRYDEKPRQIISGTGSSDGSSNIVFLRGAPRIIEQLRHSHVFRVELEYYEAGVQMLEFNTSGFEWPISGKSKGDSHN